MHPRPRDNFPQQPREKFLHMVRSAGIMQRMCPAAARTRKADANTSDITGANASRARVVSFRPAEDDHRPVRRHKCRLWIHPSRRFRPRVDGFTGAGRAHVFKMTVIPPHRKITPFPHPRLIFGLVLPPAKISETLFPAHATQSIAAKKYHATPG